MAQFGSGVATLTPTGGNTAANPTPIQLKVQQENTVEFKGDLKELFGQSQMPVQIKRGKVKISGKIKFASQDPNDINQVFFGQVVTTGGAQPVWNESHAPGATVTPTVGSGLAVTSDQGVINGDTGKSMTRVPSAPAVGQYSFTPAVTGGSPSAAEYIFNASETASKVLISYTTTVTTGSTLTLTNQLMGTAPTCTLLLYSKTDSSVFALQLNCVTLGSFSIPTKQDDYWVTESDFSVAADAAGNIGNMYVS